MRVKENAGGAVLIFLIDMQDDTAQRNAGELSG
jgi:hypothetical protein